MRQVENTNAIDRMTLMHARHAARITQRELSRRAADHLGAPDREAALQQSVSRIERGRPVSVEPEAIEAIATALGLRGGVDLTKPYRWVYKNTGSYYANKTHDPIMWLGGRLPSFSDVHGAWEARGWVTFAEGRVAPPLDMCGIYEVFHTDLMAELGDDHSRLALDPSYEEFCELAGVQARTAAHDAGR
jgi:transcriptional regulator with XRE-family HTH domain